MATWIRYATSQYLPLGPFVDSSNGVAMETGLTPTVMLRKHNGSTFAARASTEAIVESTNLPGNYFVPLTSADVDTYGTLRLQVQSSGTHLPVWVDVQVVPTQVWDSFFSTGDFLTIDVVQWQGSATTTLSTGMVKVELQSGIAGAITTATLTTAFYNALSSQVGVQSSFSTGNFTTGYRDAVQGNATGSISTATLSSAVLDAISSQVSAQSTFSTGNFTTGWRDAVQSLINGAITTATPTTQVFDLIVTAMNAGSSQSTGNFTTGLFDRTLVAGSLTSGAATTGFYAAHSRTWEVDGMNLAELLSVIAASAAGESSGFESGSTSARIFAVDGSTTARIVVEATTDGNRAVITLTPG